MCLLQGRKWGVVNSEFFSVFVRYCMRDSAEWVEVVLSPDSYFEECDEAGLDLDSVPRWLHAVEYLSVDDTRIHITELTVRDERDGKCRTVVETFWDDGRSRTIDVHDQRTGYRELIVSVYSEPQARPSSNILRFDCSPSGRGLLSHTVVFDEADGSQSERRAYSKSWK